MPAAARLKYELCSIIYRFRQKQAPEHPSSAVNLGFHGLAPEMGRFNLYLLTTGLFWTPEFEPQTTEARHDPKY